MKYCPESSKCRVCREARADVAALPAREYEIVLKFVKPTLCTAYADTRFTAGILLGEACTHPWCQGALEVANRASLAVYQAGRSDAKV